MHFNDCHILNVKSIDKLSASSLLKSFYNIEVVSDFIHSHATINYTQSFTMLPGDFFNTQVSFMFNSADFHCNLLHCSIVCLQCLQYFNSIFFRYTRYGCRIVCLQSAHVSCYFPQVTGNIARRVLNIDQKEFYYEQLVHLINIPHKTGCDVYYKQVIRLSFWRMEMIP